VSLILYVKITNGLFWTANKSFVILDFEEKLVSVMNDTPIFLKNGIFGI
jgi:hypothetical protein